MIKLPMLNRMAIAIVITAYSSICLANFGDEFESFFGDQALTIVNGGVVSKGLYQGQIGKARWDGNVEIPLRMSFSAPSINGGCGGFDYHFGSFDFAIGDNFQQYWQSFASNTKAIATYSLITYLSSLCQTCTSAMHKLQEIAQSFNNMQLGSCEAAKALINSTNGLPAVDNIRNKSQEFASTATGWWGSAFKAKEESADDPIGSASQAISHRNSSNSTAIPTGTTPAVSDDERNGVTNLGYPIFRVLNAQTDDAVWRRLSASLTPDVSWDSTNTALINTTKERIMSDLSFLFGMTIFESNSSTAAAANVSDNGNAAISLDNMGTIQAGKHPIYIAPSFDLQHILDSYRDDTQIPKTRVCDLSELDKACKLKTDSAPFDIAVGIKSDINVNMYERFITLKRDFFGATTTDIVTPSSIIGKLDAITRCKVDSATACSGSAYTFTSAQLVSLNFMSAANSGINFWDQLVEHSSEPGKVVLFAKKEMQKFEVYAITESITKALDSFSTDIDFALENSESALFQEQWKQLKLSIPLIKDKITLQRDAILAKLDKVDTVLGGD